MKNALLSIFLTSPFEGLVKHTEKVKECILIFKNAIECYVTLEYERFEILKEEIINLEKEADKIKRGIRGHLPKGAMMPVDKFQIFLFLKEQDNTIDAIEESLEWISYRSKNNIPEDIKKDLVTLVEAVIETIEELPKMVLETKKYFENFSDAQRNIVKNIIRGIHIKEGNADKREDSLKRKLFAMDIDSTSLFHVIRLIEIIGSIADHAENAGDMIRAMIAR
ncbi:MAG: TIGR00153 family protein [Deltaproteobacteria bacterium]|nr:TIGR00153 family protein [Deltaproteobacteria bacterium]